MLLKTRSVFEQRFRIHSDPKHCQLPEPSKRRGYSFPELLLRHRFTDTGWVDEKRIYLPATEKFPEATYIAETTARFQSEKSMSLAGKRSTRGSKTLENFQHPVDDFTRGYLLEQARARISKKMLPSYRVISTDLFRTEGAHLSIFCESVIEGPKSLLGSYFFVQYNGGSTGNPERVVQNAIRNLYEGSKHQKPEKPLTRSLEELLEKANPDFPWHYNYTRDLA
ncbi:MAG: hypothetical protein K2W82_15860 [Candidatus Obscuribacterales bacterium]|nr:hypothetical protein [Candidatus Obscuribacterales bacterium]